MTCGRTVIYALVVDQSRHSAHDLFSDTRWPLLAKRKRPFVRAVCAGFKTVMTLTIEAKAERLQISRTL